MANNLKLSASAEAALSRLQDTRLDPMEEVLFKAWATANNIDKPDKPEDMVDYRGIYKATGGRILPHGELRRIAEQRNNEIRVRQALLSELEKGVESEQQQMVKAQDQAHKERQSIIKLHSDKQKIQSQSLQNQSKQMELQAKPYENEALKYQNEGKRYDTEAKRIDFASKLMTNLMGTENATGSNYGGTASEAPTSESYDTAEG